MTKAPLRIFIIGCPRSGTTLLQSFLAAHSEMVTLPETHFWPTISRKRGLWRFVARVSPMSSHNARLKLLELGLSEIQIYWPDKLSLRNLSEAFYQAMDAHARKRGKSGWVEKTPRHLHYLKLIERYVPSAHFIHMVRPGQQVIASMRQVTKQYPEVWGGERDIETCIRRWVSDITVSLRALRHERHHSVMYDDLVQDPDHVMRELCDNLELPWEEGLLSGRVEAYRSVKETGSAWTDDVKGPLASSGDRKFREVLPSLEQDQVISHLKRCGLWGCDLRTKINDAKRH